MLLDVSGSLKSQSAMMQINGSVVLIELYQPGHRYRHMSALGQKRTNHRRPKSAVVRFGPKADKRGNDRIVRYVP